MCYNVINRYIIYLKYVYYMEKKMKKKSNFEEAVDLSLNNWVASIEAEEKLPVPSEKYRFDIKHLFNIDIETQV